MSYMAAAGVHLQHVGEKRRFAWLSFPFPVDHVQWPQLRGEQAGAQSISTLLCLLRKRKLINKGFRVHTSHSTSTLLQTLDPWFSKRALVFFSCFRFIVKHAVVNQESCRMKLTVTRKQAVQLLTWWNMTCGGCTSVIFNNNWTHS